MDDCKDFPNHASQMDALARIEGQVRGIKGMIDERRYCVDILTQCKAVHAALRRVERQVFEAHLQSCVVGALDGDEERDRKIAEILTLFDWDANKSR